MDDFQLYAETLSFKIFITEKFSKIMSRTLAAVAPAGITFQRSIEDFNIISSSGGDLKEIFSDR